MLAFILGLLGVNPLGQAIEGLNAAYKAKLTAQNDTEKIAADQNIERMHQVVALVTAQAGVVKEAMGHRAFWIVWCLFAVPLAGWWTAVMADTVFLFGWHIAEIPPQLIPWADDIFHNVFVSGAAVAGATGVANVVSRAIIRRG